MSVTDSENCDLVFYTHPLSRGQIVRWMLEETGIPYRQVLLDYEGAMKTDTYLAINPMGKVPALTHRGKVVTECAAICAYLADAFPQAGLAPDNASRADYYRWLFFAAGPLEAAVVDRSLNVSIPQGRERMVGYGTYEQTVAVIAAAVASREYIAGDSFTAADVYVGSHLIWGVQFGSLPQRSEFDAYIARLVNRPAYRNAKAIDEALGSAG